MSKSGKALKKRKKKEKKKKAVPNLPRHNLNTDKHILDFFFLIKTKGV